MGQYMLSAMGNIKGNMIYNNGENITVDGTRTMGNMRLLFWGMWRLFRFLTFFPLSGSRYGAGHIRFMGMARYSSIQQVYQRARPCTLQKGGSCVENLGLDVCLPHMRLRMGLAGGVRFFDTVVHGWIG
jgi:hypothetical protein